MQEQTRTTGQPETLNGQQMAALQKQYGDAFKAALADIELRKLALDQARLIAISPMGTGRDVMELAREMHAFLTAAEVKLTISG